MRQLPNEQLPLHLGRIENAHLVFAGQKRILPERQTWGWIMSFRDILLDVGKLVLGKEKMSQLAINRLIGRGRTRPHPWSTRYDDYVCWSGLTDRSYFARLLPVAPPPSGPPAPAPADVVKLFLAAKGAQQPCAKSTCLFPAFAQYLTDGFLRTRLGNTPPGPGTRPIAEDRRRTTSNHEIDLSTLYGRTEEQTAVLRTGKGGRLKSQMIGREEFPPYLYAADGRPRAEFCGADGLLVLDEPLGIRDAARKDLLFAVGGDRVNASIQVAAINILLLREHNRVAAMLAQANPSWDDERLFQIARNILIVMFIRLVIQEYINHIASAPFPFTVNPAMVWKAEWNRPNWMTIEFTLLYRWHSLVPETMQWAGQTIDAAQTLVANERLVGRSLADTFVDIAASPAARMGLGNIAWFMEKAELHGIEQGRVNRLQGYNAYRRAMGLDPAKSFADVVGTSKDPADQARRAALADGLQRLYGDVERMDFYTGLFAEPCGKNSPVPELVLAMVAMDAFSQALPNPLLSEHIWGDPVVQEKTFTKAGLALLDQTQSLRDILARNSGDLGDRFVGMTRPGWKRG